MGPSPLTWDDGVGNGGPGASGPWRVEGGALGLLWGAEGWRRGCGAKEAWILRLGAGMTGGGT